MDGADHRTPPTELDRPSRRDMLTGGAAAALGCGLPDRPAAAADEQALPRSGGTLRLGLGGGSTTDTPSPLDANDSVMIAVVLGLYNGLVENGPDNRPLPKLAESFEPGPGATEWIFTLRKGVAFHNGKEFDADDAVYSLNLHRGNSASGAAGPMRAVADVAKLDGRRIKVTLTSGNADFPTVLTDYHLMMVPNGFKDWSMPIGTGAFSLARFDPGQRIVLKKAGTYWMADRGHLDGVDITVINDTVARMNALIFRRVDAINRADPRTVSRIGRSPSFQIVRAAGGWFPIMAMQVDRDPFTSPDLRQALKLAVDREQMIKTLFSGYGSLGNDNPIPPGDPFFNNDLPQTPYDPDKARFHFRKAGVSDPRIVLQASDAAFNGALDMASQFQASTSACGIKVEVKPESADGYFSKVWLIGAFVASYWGGRPSATQMLSVAYRSGAPWNETHWRDPAFDALLDAAQAETDPLKRKRHIWDMQAMLTERGGSIIPCFRDWLDARSDKVGGHTPHSGFDMDNGLIAEKAYFKA